MASDGVYYHYRECPACHGENTHWMRGVHFDHLRKCVCGKVYDPAEEVRKFILERIPTDAE